MGKYGKKMEINLSPLAYNIGILGESGIGKTTVIKEVCEKLVGEDGYLFLECGKEDGDKTVNGLMSESCEDWDKYEEVIEDIIENKATDYPNLKVVVIDTIDQLFEISEPEVVSLHNKENEKRADTINSAFGGFGKGLDKAIEIVLNSLWSLKSVGVSFIVIGHTKRREIEDVVTGQTYSTLTTNMQQRYFNAIKTKLDILGVASIDRDIVQQKTGKKNPVTKKEETKSVIMSESRKITFRDDNYVIDSKSRFANIVDSISLDSDAFIKAVNDAILAEHSKGSKTVEQSKVEQEKAEAIKLKAVADKNEKDKADKELKSAISKITDFIKANKSDMTKIKPILEESKRLEYSNPTEIDKIEDALAIIKMFNL